jgi:hypothetical protein
MISSCVVDVSEKDVWLPPIKDDAFFQVHVVQSEGFLKTKEYATESPCEFKSKK